MNLQASHLAKNIFMNLFGQVIPLIIGVISMPFIIRGLGVERFGLLSIAWVVMSYFTVFDLGLGRATIKFISEALGREEADEIPRIVWTAATGQAIFGIVGAIVLFGLTTPLVTGILKISPELVGEAKKVFYILAVSIPVILISGSFSGFLEAFQRFDLVNFVRVPFNSLTFILPLAGVLMNFNLPGIVVMIFIARIAAMVTFMLIGFRLAPGLRYYSSRYGLLMKLFSFGGWVMISSIAGPILTYLDRFLIGTILSLTAVAYYTAPYEAITRLWVIPVSMTLTLFPAFSTLNALDDKERVESYFSRSIKFVLLVLGPITIIIGILAHEILQLWLGSDFAARSTTVLQVLALGVLVNSLAHFPFALLQGKGRPDLPAKFHLAELVIFTGLAWLLIKSYGINGAAMAWTIRVVIDALLLFGSVSRVLKIRVSLLNARGIVWAVAALLIFGIIDYALMVLTQPLGLLVQLLVTAGLLMVFAVFSWLRILDVTERETVLKVFTRKKN